jgi:hypothetical protein
LTTFISSGIPHGHPLAPLASNDERTLTGSKRGRWYPRDGHGGFGKRNESREEGFIRANTSKEEKQAMVKESRAMESKGEGRNTIGNREFYT